MRFVNRTEYTYHTLKEYNKRHLSFWRPFLIVLYSILGAVLLMTFALYLLVMPEYDALLIAVDIFLLVYCVFSLYRYTAGLGRAIRKQAEEGAVSTVRFTEEGIEDHTEKKNGVSDVTLAYSGILKVTESQDAYYLYIQRQAAFIVSKYGFVEGDPLQFVAFLKTKIDPKKIHLKESTL